MFKKSIWISFAVFLVFAVGAHLAAPPEGFSGSVPKTAMAVVKKIKAGAKDWPFDKDGSVFQNREGKLPADGKYLEYTVVSRKMAKALKEGNRPNRGKQRIVYDTKNKIFYYTDDHYKSFTRIR